MLRLQPVTQDGYRESVTRGPLGPLLEEFVYPHVLVEALRAGPFSAHVVQRAREDGWTVKQTRAYVATLKALAETAALAMPDADPVRCLVCPRALPRLTVWDGRSETRAYCSNACRQKAYRQRQPSTSRPVRLIAGGRGASASSSRFGGPPQ